MDSMKSIFKEHRNRIKLFDELSVQRIQNSINSQIEQLGHYLFEGGGGTPLYSIKSAYMSLMDRPLVLKAIFRQLYLSIIPKGLCMLMFQRQHQLKI